jgi:hypothetical protein
MGFCFDCNTRTAAATTATATVIATTTTTATATTTAHTGFVTDTKSARSNPRQ